MKPLAATVALLLFAETFSAFGQSAPTITFISSPRQVVTIGQSLTLRVAAASPSPLTYQWKRNGRPIPGATDPFYRIESAAPNRDQGWYQALVRDDGGTTTSAVVFVNVAIENARVVSARVGQLTVESSDLGPLLNIAAGSEHWLALRADGTVAAGGSNYGGLTDVPPGLRDVVGIAASASASLALKSDGRLVVWGNYTQISPAPRSPRAVPIPSGLSQVVKIVAGQDHGLALKSDGTVVGFGWNDDGQATPRNLTEIIGVAAGYNNSFAWKADGGVVGWGANLIRVSAELVGMRDVADIVAGEDFAIALMNDGRLNGMGPGYSGTGSVPLGLPSMVGLAAGDLHALALDDSGRVTTWGWMGSSRAVVAADDRETFAVSANGGHSLFLRGSRSSTAQSPIITESPRSHTVPLGSTAVLAVRATGSPEMNFQWTRNGALLAGAQQPTLVIAPITHADAGHYLCQVTNAAGSAESAAATLSVIDTASIGRMVNLSALALISGGDPTLTLGFTLFATGPGPNPSVLVRGVGPSLNPFGVSSALADPALELFSSGVKILENDHWNGDPQVASIGTRVGAFPLASATSTDAALALSGLPPGAYYVVIRSANGAAGLVLGELYDTTPVSHTLSSARGISNASVRANLVPGISLQVGLIVGGETSRSFLIRAIGPSLASFGVGGPLTDPELRLTSGTNLVGINDDWIPMSPAPEATVGAFRLPPGSRDASLLVTLAPGAYVAHVRNMDGAGGVALVEVYELP